MPWPHIAVRPGSRAREAAPPSDIGLPFRSAMTVIQAQDCDNLSMRENIAPKMRCAMTQTINLSPEMERMLQARATASGQKVTEFVAQTLEEKRRRQPTADELLAPFRKQVEDSGMTDEQLEGFFEEVREEI